MQKKMSRYLGLKAVRITIMVVLIAVWAEGGRSVAPPTGSPDCNANGVPDERDIPHIRYRSAEYVHVEGSTLLNDLATADLNGDGAIDLALADPGVGVVVMRNVRDAGFSTPAVWGAAGPFAIVAADLDSDGRIDLVAAHPDSNEVSVLWNAGDANFDSVRRIPVGMGPIALAAADFDGDGATDLVVVNQWSSSLSILRNNRNRTFSPVATVPTGEAPYGILAADLDGNGTVDLASTAYSNQPDDSRAHLEILRNDGHAGFQTTQIIPLDPDPIAVVHGDFDEDGDVDLIVGHAAFDKMSFLANDGGGMFVFGTELIGDETPARTRAVDFDGDGHLDLLTLNETLSVLRGLGDGRFVPPSSFAIPFGERSPAALGLGLADLDDDGDLDVVSSSEQAISIFRNMGGGRLFAPVSIRAGGGPLFVAAADVDQDGWTDIIAANQDDDSVWVLRNTGGGESFVMSSSTRVASPSAPLIVADLDDDRDPDVVVANAGLGFSILRNESGRFVVSGRLAEWARPPLAIGDLDGDRLPEIITMAPLPSHLLYALHNQGNATFAIGSEYSIGGLANGIAAADLDSDGDQDLAIFLQNRNRLQIARNIGHGRFDLVQQTEVDSAPDEVLPIDLDRDGRIDLVALDRYGQRLSVFRNTGAGGVAVAQSFETAPFSFLGPAGDFDRDADLDLMVGSSPSQDGAFVVLRNAGDGALTPDLRIPVDHTSLAAADFNRDGALDLAVGYHLFSSRVLILMSESLLPISRDCNTNRLPDECEPDADGDRVPDVCDRCPGRDDRRDSNGDGISDCLTACTGDCDGSGSVTVDELVRGVGIALGNLALDTCPIFDCNGSAQVTVDCLVRAVTAALDGCL